MEYTGLIFEILFLCAGVYLYLFAIGKVSTPNPDKKEQSEAFRQNNKGWLRFLSLALVAIMLVNIVLHIQELM